MYYTIHIPPQINGTVIVSRSIRPAPSTEGEQYKSLVVLHNIEFDPVPHYPMCPAVQ